MKKQTNANIKSINEQLKNIFEILGIVEDTVPKPQKTAKSKKSAKTKKRSTKEVASLPDGYCSGRTIDCLNEIQYYPNGDAPTEHNAFYTYGEKDLCWYCSDKQVAFINPEDNKTVVFAKNPYDRFTTYVAQKWASERDWIPEHRYSFEDNKSEVGVALKEALKNGVDRADITKICFDHLDEYNNAKPDKHKTLEKIENCNDAERFILSTLFTGDVETLHKLIGLDGDILPLPTKESLEELYDYELEQFERIKVIFDRVKEKHSAASLECWMSAQCYALNMPTREAIQFIFGDRANGKRKYHRCEVSYSQKANQVFTWLLEEFRGLQEEGLCEGLDKWHKVFENWVAQMWDEKAYKFIKDYLVHIEDKSPRDEYFITLIKYNPIQAKYKLLDIIAKAKEAYGVSLLDEICRSYGISEEVDKNVTVTA